MKIKSFLIAAVAATLALVGCTKDGKFGDPKVEISNSTIEVPAEGATETISFVATRDWQVTNVPAWIQIPVGGGVASRETQQMTIIVEPTLDARTATLNITAGEITATFTVNQSRVEPSIAVSGAESPIEVTAEGGDINIIVEASRDWYIDGLPSWISAYPNNGVGTGKEDVMLRVAENEGEARSATLSFTCLDKTVEITVNQAAAPVSEKIELAGTEWRMDYGFVDPDMTGYFLGIRFVDETNVILAEGDPEDGFWDDDPIGTGTYTLNEDGTFSLDLFDEEGGEEVYEGFIQDGLLYLTMYYEEYFEEYGEGCAFVQYIPE